MKDFYEVLSIQVCFFFRLWKFITGLVPVTADMSMNIISSKSTLCTKTTVDNRRRLGVHIFTLRVTPFSGSIASEIT